MTHPEKLSQHELTVTEIGIIRESGTGDRFMIGRGLNPALIDQLIKKSKQSHIRRYCPRDAEERFASPESFETWRTSKGGRNPYPLTDGSSDLAGLIWYGPQPFTGTDILNPATDPNHTFAIRMYEGTEGRGLARPFMIETMHDYVEGLIRSGEIATFNGIHLETDADNPRSIPLYKKVGFEEVSRDEEGRVTMVITPERIFG